MAHLWFVTVHPFEDGNGRIARAIADLLLARADGSSQRFYSMSSQIWRERAAYYRILETTQKGTSDITRWMDWFLACLGRAIVDTQDNFDAVIAKAVFWAGPSNHALTPASATSLTGCGTALRASSPLPNGPGLPNAPGTKRSGILPTSSTKQSSPAVRPAAPNRATGWHLTAKRNCGNKA